MAATTSSALSSQPDDVRIRAQAYKRLHPRRYLEAFLEQGHRPDGRPLASDASSSASSSKSQWRGVQINVGSVSTAHGSALVRLGDTTVVCGIKAETAAPDAQRPNEGWIVPNLDLPAISAPQFKPGPPGDEAQTYSQQLHELVTSTDILPLKRLCIEPSKAAWVLYVDLVCINYDGNPFDAAVLALAAALRNTRLPLAVWDPDIDQVFCHPTARRRLRDELNPIPLACTFAIFDSRFILPDPDAFESPLCSTTVTVALDAPPPPLAQTGSADDSKAGPLRLIRQTGLGGVSSRSVDGDGGKTTATTALDGLACLERCVADAQRRVAQMAKVLYAVDA